MSLSLADRGYLERFIDDMKNEQAVRFYELFKSKGASKDSIVWFCKGAIYGEFIGYFVTAHHSKMSISELSELDDVVTRRTNEIADVLAEYYED
ncbi:MAG: hypothetical protein M1386_05315 [Candidatus Thermoplasmatota archaeon]|nr:hypothetical protein [Candidatus Thermoplasmatota archaeon]